MQTADLPCLADEVRNALRKSPYLLRKPMDVEEEKGRIVLRGNVESFFQKQMAQETLMRIDGVESVDNLLEVNW